MHGQAFRGTRQSAQLLCRLCLQADIPGREPHVAEGMVRTQTGGFRSCLQLPCHAEDTICTLGAHAGHGAESRVHIRQSRVVDHPVHRPIGALAERSRFVERLHVGVEFRTLLLKLGRPAWPLRRFEATVDLESLLQLPAEVGLVGLTGVQLQTEGPQPHGLEPTLNHLQRGHLLRHKQDPLSLGHAVGNQIRNGLRFARTWRPLQDEAHPALCRQDGGKL